MASFADLAQNAQTFAARTFQSVTAATTTLWFGTSATAAPANRAAFTVTVSDVTPGQPRIQRDQLSGEVVTPTGSIRVMFKQSAIAFTPIAMETVFLFGPVKASASAYRITAVESGAGLYELEAKPEAQYFA